MEKNKSQVLREIMELAKSELNENGHIGYTMPDGKHHIYIYVDDSMGHVVDVVEPEDYYYVIEPNRVVDGAMEPMGDTTAADYNDFAELLVGCAWCIDEFERDSVRAKEVVEASLDDNSPSRSLEALKDVVVLTCTHQSRYGADSFVSFHSSEDKASKWAVEVAKDAEYREDRDDESFQIDISHYDFSQFPRVKAAELKREDFDKGVVGETNKTVFEKAAEFVDDSIANRDGEDLFYIANAYYTLSHAEGEQDLTRDEALKLTERVVEASFLSAVPLLTAERIDAVRTMLEYGITSIRSLVLPELTPAQAKKVLLECELEDFATIVDQLAVDNQRFYAPDRNDITAHDIDKVEKAITDILGPSVGIDAVISLAEAQKGNDVDGGKVARTSERDL